jgi:hypothetical protein
MGPRVKEVLESVVAKNGGSFVPLAAICPGLLDGDMEAEENLKLVCATIGFQGIFNFYKAFVQPTSGAQKRHDDDDDIYSNKNIVAV